MNRTWLLLVPGLCIAGYLIISLMTYQNLVKDASTLEDDQCLTVNPIIIERKNKYLNSLEAAKNNDTAKYERETSAYFEHSKEYVERQSKWLEEQRFYMNRWDFKFFLPSYMRQAAQYQYDSRKADVESTKLLIEAFEASELDQSLSQDLEQKAIEKVHLRNEAEGKYNVLLDTSRKLDWRTYFTRAPETKCPEENLDFPVF